MGFLESLFGLGQSDVQNVFRNTIKALTTVEQIASKEARHGMALAISAMLDELLRGDVATQETFDILMKELKEWHSGKTK